MTYDFEVRSVIWHHNRGDFIFARHLGNKHDFDIPDGSLFGDIPVYHYADMRHVKDGEDSMSADVFVLRPIPMKRLAENHFLQGQRVVLTVAEE